MNTGWALSGWALSALILSSSPTFAAEKVGTAVISRGKVVVKTAQGSSALKAGSPVHEGDYLMTGPDGALKVILTDQSELSLGPDTTVRAERGAKAESPAAISVIKGQFRAKVLKDLLKANDKGSRLRMTIRTKSATMGVRGTDFSVIFNGENQVTSLVTFEGGVAMVKNEEDRPPTSFDAVADLLKSDQAVVVTEGNFSTANPASDQTTVPTKISPAQFEALKASSLTAPTAGVVPPLAGAPFKSFNLLPPGVDPKSFVGTGTSLTNALERVVSSEELKNAVKDRVPSDEFGGGKNPPPEGFYDASTGKSAPPAGGFLDLRTGIYVPPPPGSAFDPNTGVYVASGTVGGFDPKSGAYVPPKGSELDPIRGFVPSKDAKPGDALPPPLPAIPGAPRAPGMPEGPGRDGMKPPPMPGGPLDEQPRYPVSDPYCPNCGAPLPPPPVNNGSSTNLNVRITVF